MPETARRESLCVVRSSTSETNLERARTGDARAFEELVEEISPSLQRWLEHVLRSDAEMASGVLQDAWLAAWQRILTFESVDHLGRWMHLVATRRAISILRRDRRLIKAAWNDELGEDASLASPAAPDANVVDHEAVTVLRAAIARLPDHYRGVATLHYIHGQSIAQIALMLPARIPTVKMRLHRARRRLRRVLRDCAPS